METVPSYLPSLFRVRRDFVGVVGNERVYEVPLGPIYRVQSINNIEPVAQPGRALPF